MAALITASAAEMPSVSLAQMGQMGMAPASGVANRAVQGFKGLNENGPGILYYGINAADRGLGYVGSYMTLGGYIPGFQDDLGGLWAADVRSHLSVNGGFFSNVGAVRKQFLGGSLLGIGVYWDYDGDLNQYSDTTITDTSGSYVFGGGQVYNQVGISGEWLTDFGNLRSNGYIPVGTTAEYIGPFVGNSILCQNGLNAGLAGTDLEVGAYIPGLTDWAGMISVGGYAYGNARYNFPDGQDVVPWFGGVYTRLDMTFIENWDFSLQYNNDSYFESTGFARLTYRMGGSRRRNVPDQMEQPMMRNEHIVRAHQTPEVAINPTTGTPWRVFHVDNSGSGPGNGSATSPYTTLASAQGAATNPYDIVYVHAGTSSASTPYLTPASGYSFLAANQYFIGEGSSLVIPTTSCGDQSYFGGNSSSVYPVLTNPLGVAIAVNQPDTVVDHFQIVGSRIGISDGLGFSSGVANISDVIISGNGPGQRGVEIANSTAAFSFDNVRLANLTDDGFVVSATQGSVAITNSSIESTTGAAVRVTGAGASTKVDSTVISKTTGNAFASTGTQSSISVSKVNVTDTAGNAVVASGPNASAVIADSTIRSTTGSALVASGDTSSITSTATVIASTGNPAIAVLGTSAQVNVDSTSITDVTGAGVLVAGASSIFTMTNASRIDNTSGDGISLITDSAFASISGKSLISRVGGDGIYSEGASVHLLDSTIRTVGGSGIDATGVDGTRVVWVQGGTITDAQISGITALNTNLRVERLDPSNPRSQPTAITNAGTYGIEVVADSAAPISAYQVLVDSVQISGVSIGISASANADAANLPPPVPSPNPVVPTINLTARNNTITTSGSGAGIAVSAVYDASVGYEGRPLSRVNALITANTINAGPGTILLTTAGDTTIWTTGTGGVAIDTPAAYKPVTVAAGSAADLGNINNGATVDVEPVPSSTVFNRALSPPLPPPPPTPP